MPSAVINAVYRYYSGDNAKKRPSFFSKHLCFESFLAAWRELGEARGRLVFLCDAVRFEKGPVESLARKSCDEVLFLGGIGNCPSYLRSIDIAVAFPEGDLVYLSEDDYLYRPEALSRLAEARSGIPEASYFTLYDHPDRYTRKDDAPFRRRELYLAGDHHWRTVESTCMTYAGLVEAIRGDKLIHRFVARKGGTPNDRRMWRAIQGIGTYVCKIPKRLLIGAVPALATHMEADLLSPAVDWAEVAASVRRPAGR